MGAIEAENGGDIAEKTIYAIIFFQIHDFILIVCEIGSLWREFNQFCVIRHLEKCLVSDSKFELTSSVSPISFSNGIISRFPKRKHLIFQSSFRFKSI